MVVIDIQSMATEVALTINEVGVSDVLHPVTISETNMGTNAIFDMFVELDSNSRGTHMSRFIEILNEKQWNIDFHTIQEMLEITMRRLNAHGATINSSFDLFIEKSAPVSNVKSLLDYKCNFNAKHINGKTSIWQSVEVPVTSLCPCSKEISEYGAHNQRSIITIKVLSNSGITFKELIKIAEDEASCDLYGILKRQDEKYVTERAYDNPKFVEDLVRIIATNLKNNTNIYKFVVKSKNFESIHNHNAYAMIQG